MINAIIQLINFGLKLFIWLLPFLLFFWSRGFSKHLMENLAVTSWINYSSVRLYTFLMRCNVTAEALGPSILLLVASILASAKITDKGKVRLAAVACFASALLSGWNELKRLDQFGLGFFQCLQWVDYYVLTGILLAVGVGLIPYYGVKPYLDFVRKLLGFLPHLDGPKRIDSGLYGSARFQSVDEIKTQYGSGGIILGEAYAVPQSGSYDSRNPSTWGQGGQAPLLRYEPGSGQSSGHGLNIGGAGSGKSTSSAIPNALEWSGALVCFDPAREIWSVTKRDREEKGRKVFVLDPELNENGCNVLDWIDREHASQDLDNLAAWIGGETQNEKGKEPSFWNTSSRNLIKTILAYVLLSDEVSVRSLKTFAELISLGQNRLEKKLKSIAAKESNSLIVNLARPFIDLPSDTWGGIYAQASNNTIWMHDERLLRLVSSNSFDLNDIAKGDTDVFISVKSAIAKQAPGLVRVLIGSIMKSIVNQSGMKEGRCLFLIDEAASLGYMEILQTALAEYRKFKISLLLYYQSIAQLETQWSRAGKAVWFDNSTFIQLSAVNSHETAREVSSMLGSYTAETESINESSSANSSIHQTLGSSGQSYGENKQAVKRMLMQPEEIMNMRLDEQIILRAGQSPIKCGKAFYYRRDEWKLRVDKNPYA